MDVRDDLPKGWVHAELSEYCDVVLGQSPPSSTYNETGKGLPFFQGKTEFGEIHPVPQKWCSSPRKVAEKDSVLVSVRAPVGPTNICQEKCCIGRGLAAIHGLQGVPSLFILYLIRANENNLAEQGTGTTFNSISGDVLRNLPVLLPPLPEQHKIVSKIEELFTKLDAGVQELRHGRTQLKRYRQSVLKAAASGELTKEWREAHQDELEPTSELLARILKERRAKWEADQLAKMRVAGKRPTNNEWKSKYVEPRAMRPNGLSDLPHGWLWINLDCLLTRIQSGKSFKCEERPPVRSEIGVVKVSSVSWGEFNELESKTCLDQKLVNELLFVKRGDFLFSRANTIQLVGACVVVNRKVKRRIMLSDKILRFRLAVLPARWLLLSLRSQQGRNEIERLATGNQDSMRNIGQDRIRQIRIPLPPFAEIETIIQEFERLLSISEAMENAIEQTLKQAERMRQSILKKAFEGKLVAQNPNDEPAELLLERIKQERAKREAEKRAASKPGLRRATRKHKQIEGAAA